MDRRWVALGGIAAITLVAVYLLALRPPIPEEAPQGPLVLIPLSPVGTVDAVPPEIRWRAVPGARSYDVEILHQRRPLWKGEASVASIPFPRELEARLREGAPLLYRVRAKGRFGKELAVSELVFFQLSDRGGGA